MNATFSRHNPDWRNHSNFSWAKNANNYPRPNFNNFQPPHCQHNLPNHAPESSFKSPSADKKSTDLEKILTSFMQNTGHDISRLEGQMSQLASFISERPKGTLPSELITNSRNFSQAHVAQKDPMNQCNVVHTLWLGKQVDNQVSMPLDSTQTSTPSSSTSPTSEDNSATKCISLQPHFWIGLGVIIMYKWKKNLRYLIK